MITFSRNISEHIEGIFLQYGFDKLLVLADTNTLPLFEALKIQSVKQENVFILPPGEQHKDLAHAAMVWEFLAAKGSSRKTLLINFGGGVITDLGGFSASTFMRGIPFINIPTTLLGMVDAAIGGKTGINYLQLKNQIGTFQEAFDTVIDVNFLLELPNQELINGWAEVIKHSIIEGDAIWEQCKKGIPNLADLEEWELLVQQNTKIKLTIVQGDPKENGARKMLNFGHTVGHAIESVYLKHNDFVGHGPAVAAGMIVETAIASTLNLISNSDLKEITAAIDKVFPRLNFPSEWQSQIIEFVKADKKNSNNKILMVLPKRPGQMTINNEVNEQQIIEALNLYAQSQL